MTTKAIMDKIKSFETKFTGEKIDASLPFVIRLDGHAFSKFTRGLKKPYDYNLHKVFTVTAMYLMKEFHANAAYTHSDEISLLFYPQKTKNHDGWCEPLYGGRIQKMITICASMCTMFFNKELVNTFSSIQDQYIEKLSTYNRMINSQAFFDCRIFQLPTDEEMFTCIHSRSQIDCRRNHVFELSRKYYTKSELHGKHTHERIIMLKEKNIDWYNEPACFRRGSFFKRVKRNTGDKSIRYDFEEVDIDLVKFNDEINSILKCEVYEKKPIIVRSEVI